ncbi:LysR family transcriptional regulator [Duganella sp. FT80W]|uniref:LysR family transcriptional regulator n=1 Tax=Duganella guangzhouensis TaxID=2666084 RepID=A0A6I2L565_9BURK|nr:LysR family transcriptional regulator [Duganella guangzhouensis]MRW91786.1 LysR family transcriptional regulator [Duganella guangzhouensis]
MLSNLSDLDLRLIRVYLAVVDAGGLSLAQAVLNVNQSTISTQLSTLEARLGFRLCERGRSGFRLTPKGERFAQAARRMLDVVTDFCEEARNIEKKLSGSLRIGLIGHTDPTHNAKLGLAIAHFRKRDEAVRFHIFNRSPNELEEQMLAGELDLGIGYFWHQLPELEYVPLYVENQIAYCGQGHALFGTADRIGAVDVGNYEWIGRSYPVPEFESRFGQKNYGARADNMEAVAILIMSGRYCGFLPSHFAEPYVRQGLLQVLNEDELSYRVTIHTCLRRSSRRSDIIDAFMTDLRAIMGA